MIRAVSCVIHGVLSGEDGQAGGFTLIWYIHIPESKFIFAIEFRNGIFHAQGWTLGQDRIGFKFFLGGLKGCRIDHQPNADFLGGILFGGGVAGLHGLSLSWGDALIV